MGGVVKRALPSLAETECAHTYATGEEGLGGALFDFVVSGSGLIHATKHFGDFVAVSSFDCFCLFFLTTKPIPLAQGSSQAADAT